MCRSVSAKRCTVLHNIKQQQKLNTAKAQEIANTKRILNLSAIIPPAATPHKTPEKSPANAADMPFAREVSSVESITHNWQLTIMPP